MQNPTPKPVSRDPLGEEETEKCFLPCRPTFNVVANPLPSNLAYTTGTLGLHTDIPYDRYPPGVILCHVWISPKTASARLEKSRVLHQPNRCILGVIFLPWVFPTKVQEFWTTFAAQPIMVHSECLSRDITARHQFLWQSQATKSLCCTAWASINTNVLKFSGAVPALHKTNDLQRWRKPVFWLFLHGQHSQRTVSRVLQIVVHSANKFHWCGHRSFWRVLQVGPPSNILVSACLQLHLFLLDPRESSEVTRRPTNNSWILAPN